MNTLAKAKAQALVQPAKPLAVTPNVRQFNSPAAGAALSLSNESTNVVQVVNPASTLTINVDGQNFSAFGANHFVLHVDTTAATEITLNFVRGATVLATKAIELEADQLAVLTFAAVIKANNAVTLLALGQHVVGKSEATDGNGAGSGLLLIPNGAIGSTDAGYQNFIYDGTSGIEVAADVVLPVWSAGLPVEQRQSTYKIFVKMPDLGLIRSADLYLVDADFDLDFLSNRSNLNYLSLELRPQDGSTTLILNAPDNLELSNSIGFTQPAAGSVISLTLNSTSIDYAWDGGSGTLPIPAGFFTNPPNVLVSSSGETASHIADLSVRVADLPPPFTV